MSELGKMTDAEAMERVLSAVLTGHRFLGDIRRVAGTEDRQTVRVLQGLRRLGKIAYVKVKEGGKGWQEVKS